MNNILLEFLLTCIIIAFILIIGFLVAAIDFSMNKNILQNENENVVYITASKTMLSSINGVYMVIRTLRIILIWIMLGLCVFAMYLRLYLSSQINELYFFINSVYMVTLILVIFLIISKGETIKNKIFMNLQTKILYVCFGGLFFYLITVKPVCDFLFFIIENIKNTPDFIINFEIYMQNYFDNISFSLFKNIFTITSTILYILLPILVTYLINNKYNKLVFLNEYLPFIKDLSVLIDENNVITNCKGEHIEQANIDMSKYNYIFVFKNKILKKLKDRTFNLIPLHFNFQLQCRTKDGFFINIEPTALKKKSDLYKETIIYKNNDEINIELLFISTIDIKKDIVITMPINITNQIYKSYQIEIKCHLAYIDNSYKIVDTTYGIANKSSKYIPVFYSTYKNILFPKPFSIKKAKKDNWKKYQKNAEK